MKKKQEIPAYTKTVRDVIDSIKKHFSDDDRVLSYEIRCKLPNSTHQIRYNEREVNKRLLAEKAADIDADTK